MEPYKYSRSLRNKLRTALFAKVSDETITNAAIAAIDQFALNVNAILLEGDWRMEGYEHEWAHFKSYYEDVKKDLLLNCNHEHTETVEGTFGGTWCQKCNSKLD